MNNINAVIILISWKHYKKTHVALALSQVDDAWYPPLRSISVVAASPAELIERDDSRVNTTGPVWSKVNDLCRTVWLLSRRAASSCPMTTQPAPPPSCQCSVNPTPLNASLSSMPRPSSSLPLPGLVLLWPHPQLLPPPPPDSLFLPGLSEAPEPRRLTRQHRHHHAPQIPGCGSAGQEPVSRTAVGGQRGGCLHGSRGQSKRGPVGKKWFFAPTGEIINSNYH